MLPWSFQYFYDVVHTSNYAAYIYYLEISLDGLEKTTSTLRKVVGWNEKGTRNLQNTSI
jgi:hypothetical protein